MNESDWLSCADADQLLGFLLGAKSPFNPSVRQRLRFWKRLESDRKWRLFGCACCRKMWIHYGKDRLRKAIETSERFADGLASRGELRRSRLGVERAAMGNVTRWQVLRAYLMMESSIEGAAGWDTFEATAYYVALDRVGPTIVENVARVLRFPWMLATTPAGADEKEHLKHAIGDASDYQCEVVRDVFGNPFRQVKVDPAWRTPEVIALARSVYNDRAFEKMGQVATLLEHFGCGNGDILDHCRSSSPHVRGCWVLDLLVRGKY